jgi:hypothetical protein
MASSPSLFEALNVLYTEELWEGAVAANARRCVCIEKSVIMEKMANFHLRFINMIREAIECVRAFRA